MTCPELVLLEASFDRRLGASDEATLARHLATCAACSARHRELAALSTALRVPDPTPLEHKRARLALLRAAAVVPSADRRRRWVPAVALVFAAPLAVWAGTSAWRSAAPRAPIVAPPSSSQPSVSGSPSAVPAVPSPTPSVEASDGPARIEPPRAASLRPTDASPRPRAPAAAVASREGDGASRAFREAIDAVSQGDFADGAKKMDAFRAAHPTDARVEEAAFLQAVALQRAGRLDEAKAAARRYLASYPAGAHRAQAARIAD